MLCLSNRPLIVVLTALTLTHSSMAQTNESQAAHWLAKAELGPSFHAPASKGEWEKRRKQLHEKVWELLGKLPARPEVPQVTTVSREDRQDYVLEKFQFDNRAGATVPGYALVPHNLKSKAPAILYCHWHAGQYDLGKEEILQARHMPEAPGPALAKRGFVVLGIDAYCFGERNGQGPGGPSERGSAGELTASKCQL